MVFEEVDFDAREVEVCADEVAEGGGAVCFAELGGVAGGVEFADAEDVDEVQGPEGRGVGAEDFDEGFIVCDPAFEFEGAEEGEVAGGDEVVEGLEGLQAGYVALVLEEAVDGTFGGEGEVDDRVWDGVEEAAEFGADACVCWGEGVFEEEGEAEGSEIAEKVLPVAGGNGVAVQSVAAEVGVLEELVVGIVEPFRVILELVCGEELSLFEQRKRIRGVATLFEWMDAERDGAEVSLDLCDGLPRFEDVFCDFAVVFEVIPSLRLADIAEQAGAEGHVAFAVAREFAVVCEVDVA